MLIGEQNANEKGRRIIFSPGSNLARDKKYPGQAEAYPGMLITVPF